MRCPKCKGDSRVTDSRLTNKALRRRRACTSCGHRWTTYELSVDVNALLADFRKQADEIRRTLEGLSYQLLAARSTLPRKSNGYTRVTPALNMRRPYSKEEDRKIRDLYPQLGPALHERMQGRSKHSVQARASILGVRYDRNKAHAAQCNHPAA